MGIKDRLRGGRRWLHTRPNGYVVGTAIVTATLAGVLVWWLAGRAGPAEAARAVWHWLTPGWAAWGRVGLGLIGAASAGLLIALVMRPWATNRHAARRARHWPLFPTVVGAVALGLLLVWIGYAAINHTLHADAGQPPTRIDILKTALTAVAGVGGAVALVVAYRRQRDLEQGRFTERFGAAAAQLGNPDPAVRLAGVYAMASAADEAQTYGRRQQCIDVLCGYLRLPYDPVRGNTHHTEIVTSNKPSPNAVVQTGRETVLHQKLRQNDREVRKTIVGVIAAHLKDSAEVSWSRHNFDFRGVHFDSANFGEATFGGSRTVFNGATFSGELTSFNDTVFSGRTVSFDRAEFTDGVALFLDTRFIGTATVFDGARFECDVTAFNGSTFGGDGSRASFNGVVFNGQGTSFNGVKFYGTSIEFREATFNANITQFRNAEFDTNTTIFDKATFANEEVSFANANFRGASTSFCETSFDTEDTLFEGAQFSGRKVTQFDRARFGGKNTRFDEASFRSDVTQFNLVLFVGRYTTSFGKARFASRKTWFTQAVFEAETTWFASAAFEGETDAMFGLAYFDSQTTSFDGAAFSGGKNLDEVFRDASFRDKASALAGSTLQP